MIFDDSLSEEQEDQDDDLEMAMLMIFNKDFWWLTLVPIRLYVHGPR